MRSADTGDSCTCLSIRGSKILVPCNVLLGRVCDDGWDSRQIMYDRHSGYHSRINLSRHNICRCTTPIIHAIMHTVLRKLKCVCILVLVVNCCNDVLVPSSVLTNCYIATLALDTSCSGLKPILHQHGWGKTLYIVVQQYTRIYFPRARFCTN